MRFLHFNERSEWCRERGAETGNDPWALLADPTLTCSAEIVFAPERSRGREPQVVAACLEAMSDWEECRLWITAWELWPSTEDWPAFYSLKRFS